MTPKTTQEKTDAITIKIPQAMTKALDKIAKSQDRSRSAVIRIALQKYLDRLKKSSPTN